MSPWSLGWRLIRRQRALYLFYIVTMLVFLVGRLVPGYLELAIFNKLASRQQAGLNVWSLIALMVSFELARLTAQLGSGVSEITIQWTASIALQRNMLAAILRRPGAMALSDTPEQTLNRFRDDVQDVATLLSAPVVLLGTFLFSAFAVIKMALLNTELTIIVVLPLLLVVAFATAAQNRVRRYRLASRSSTARLTAFLGSMFRSAEVIKTAGADQHVLREMREINEVRRKASVRDATFGQILDSIFYNSVDISVGLILLLAARIILRREFTVGDFALFDYYLFFVTRLPVTAGSFIVTFRQASVATGRLAAVAGSDDVTVLSGSRGSASRNPVPNGGTGDREHLRELRADNLSYIHPGGTPGISDINFCVRAGTLVVVTGRIGSGKTTLLRCLAGLLALRSGALYWNETEVADPALVMTPPRAGYVPQVPHLFSDTLRDNITLGADISEQVIQRAAWSAALDLDVQEMPEGYGTRVGPRGATLSGGQAQRAALARALVRSPDILIVDDLASAVDDATAQAISQRLLTDRSRTYLVSSNRRSIVMQADQVILLEAGRVRDCGTAAELVARNDAVNQIWH
jgi:ATP-binding cassette, subfamily B, bacterial